MSVLIVDGAKDLKITPSYIMKYDADAQVKNSVFIGGDSVDLTDNETEALEMMHKKNYRTLIINTSDELDGCGLLAILSDTDRYRRIPVRLI